MFRTDATGLVREIREYRCDTSERKSVLADWIAGGASWHFADYGELLTIGERARYPS